MNSFLDCRRGARRLAALWLALAALAAGARAAPRDDADPDALDAFDDADDELALDQEVRTVTDQHELGESRKRDCAFSNTFCSFCVVLLRCTTELVSPLAFI